MRREAVCRGSERTAGARESRRASVQSRCVGRFRIERAAARLDGRQKSVVLYLAMCITLCCSSRRCAGTGISSLAPIAKTRSCSLVHPQLLYEHLSLRRRNERQRWTCGSADARRRRSDGVPWGLGQPPSRTPRCPNPAQQLRHRFLRRTDRTAQH
eukprot:scaffold3058_cov232-Pinguiococcus_pyrenoidosus.AAC.2